MKAEDLKNSILQLAMEGKLVPQDPNDEPASVLLDKIREEKEQLIKEKKIKRNNKESFIFRKNGHFYEKIGKKGEPVCIDDEIPFEIPDSWEYCRLNSIGNIIGGGTPKTQINEYWENGDIPWLTPADMKYVEGKYVSQGARNITKLGLNKSSAQLIPKNSIIYSSRAPIGYIAISNNKLSTNQGFKSFVPINLEIVDYMYYCLISFTDEIKSRASGTTFKEISKTKFGETIIPIPPINEQKRIVKKIEELLPIVIEYGNLREKLDNLNSEFPDKLKSSILQDAIQGKLVPQDSNDEPASVLLEKIRDEKERLIKEKKIKRNKNESYIFKENNHFYEKIGKNNPICIDDELPFDIPDNWEWCKLENIIELISGRDLKKTQYNDLKKGIPYVTGASNIINGQLLINRWTDEPAVIAIKNDILLSCKGTIGKILILNENKVHIARQIMSIRLIDETLINKEYIVIFLMYYVTNLINIAKSMIPGISREDVLKINIPLPSLEEQKRIVERIDLLFEELNF